MVSPYWAQVVMIRAPDRAGVGDIVLFHPHYLLTIHPDQKGELLPKGEFPSPSTPLLFILVLSCSPLLFLLFLLTLPSNFTTLSLESSPSLCHPTPHAVSLTLDYSVVNHHGGQPANRLQVQGH